MADEPDARVRFDIAEGIATVTLARAAQMNAFDQMMHDALRRAIDRVRQDGSVRALILTGEGRAFSAGQDLGERARQFASANPPDLATSLEDNYNPLIREIVALDMPVIAAVNGIAFGAGAALALAADMTIAAASARFQFGFVTVGLGPDSGASWFLPRLVGHARAMDLTLTGRPVDAGEALAIGLVSRVLPDEELADAAYTIARGIADRSPDAIAAIKRAMRWNPLRSLDAALDHERDAQAALGRTDFYRDAVLRFAKPRR